MTVQTVLLKRQRISTGKFKLIVRYFCLDFTALEASHLTALNRHTIERYYTWFRGILFKESIQEEKLSGEVEVDESYFGATRVRGKRGRGASGKIPVIGLLKRDGKVYTKIVINCTREELLPVIKGKVLPGATVYTDGWRSYDGLIVSGYRHKRIYHDKNQFANKRNHVNGIESFWSYTKRRLRKFNGVPRDKFLLYLKESEWRFNHRETMNKSLWKIIRKYSL